MNLRELQKKIAEVLGVSNSQSELAFDVFSERIYESLYEGITLKVPSIGFFQLKTGEVKNGTRPVIFTPITIDISHDTNNLYLTFEVRPKTKNTREVDSNVFSIGVGKPLLPLTIDDLPNSETSFAVLKKSIEERAKELIAESDQIPNFNIFEDYYKFSNSPLPEDETHSTLNELTSDLDFSNVPHEPLDSSPDEKIEMLSSLIDEVPANEPVLHENEKTPKAEFNFPDNRDKTAEDAVSEFNEAEGSQDELDSEGKTSGSLLAELLYGYKDDKQGEEEIPIPEPDGKSPEEILDTIDASIFLSKEELLSEEVADAVTHVVPEIVSSETVPEEVITQEPEEPIKTMEQSKAGDTVQEELSQPEEQFIEEHYADDQKEETVGEEKVEEEPALPEMEDELPEETEEDLEPFEALLDSDKPSEEKIEWNWGDELREEFGLGHFESEEANYEMVDEKKSEETKEAESEVEKDSIRDLFTQLEKTLEHDRAFLDEQPHEEKKPTIETEIPRRKQEFKDDEKVYLEYEGPPSKYEFVPVKTSEEERRSRMAISLADEPHDYFDRRLTRSNERVERITHPLPKREATNSKVYLMYISIFAVVAIAVYLVMRNDSGSDEPTLKTPKQTISQTKIDSIRKAVENAPDSAKYLLDESNDFPISATPPVPVKSSQNSQTTPTQTNVTDSRNTAATKTQPSETQNDLYQTPKTDTRITNSIYYDGKNYNFQASSWRNKATAEQEVQRLRGLDFKVYLVEAYLPQKGGTWYRVRIGPFKSESETRQFMRENNFK